jgi:hypothetical protein
VKLDVLSDLREILEAGWDETSKATIARLNEWLK